MLSSDFLHEMNEVYFHLEQRRAQVIHALTHRVFTLESGWYNGHYEKDESGKYRMNYYPIPVVSVKGLCDIEIGFDSMTISTKLPRQKALEYSFEKAMRFPFEAYGVEDYLTDYKTNGVTIEQMRENIKESNEREIGFSFSLPPDLSENELYEFVKLLRREGFFY